MRRGPLPVLLSAVLLAGMALLALNAGPYPISLEDFGRALLRLAGHADTQGTTGEAVLLQLRGPRVAAAMLVGAALAAAGTAYQGMFRNPLVSPDILGVSAGAALGATLAIFLSLGAAAIQGFAFAGGLAAVALVWAMGGAVRSHDPLLALILTGIVVGALLGACIALLKYLADPYSQLPAITFWLLGSLAAIAPADLAIAGPLVLLGLVPMVLLRWRMNLLTLPDEEARALGANTAALRVTVVCAATLMTAAAVAISGVIGWIGLLVPHAARMLVGPDFSRMLPVAMAFGAGFLLAVDTLGRSLGAIEIPPGVLTALVGAPFFILLLRRARSSPE